MDERKNKLFLNELYSKYQLPQTYQAFLESKEELISQGKGTLLEQLESVQSTNWHEIAQEDLLATFEERQQETDQEIMSMRRNSRRIGREQKRN